MKAGDGGVVSKGNIAAFEAHLLEGEPKGHQVGTHSQEELQQEAAKEVVLSLTRGQRSSEVLHTFTYTHTYIHMYRYTERGRAVLEREREMKYHHMPEGQNHVFLSGAESSYSEVQASDGMSDPTFLGIASKFFPVATLMTELSGGFPSRETL